VNGERAGPSADPGSASASAAGTPPEDEEEEISAEREEVINAIGAFFRTADENSCIKCGQSGHAEYDCKAEGSDDVKNALNKLRDILAKKRVEAEERQEKDGAEEDQQQEREKSKHPSGKQDESMYSTPLTLIDIGNRVHGARVDGDGPANHAELDENLNIAGENGTVMSCELAMDAPAASDHLVYKKLNIRTRIGCLKTLPIYGGILKATTVAGNGLRYSPGDNRENESLFMANWEISLRHRVNKVLRHHVGRHWEKDYQIDTSPV
jgi:hypothetical protein